MNRVMEWIPEDHLARFVSEVVDELDLSAIEPMHELGHALGLEHCGQEESVMCPNIRKRLRRITLGPEDKNAVSLLYRA